MYHLWFSGSWRCQRQSCKEAKRLRIHPIYLSRSCHACPRKYGSQGSTFSFSFGFPPHMHLLSSQGLSYFLYQYLDGRVVCVELAKPGKNDFGRYPRTCGPPSKKEDETREWLGMQQRYFHLQWIPSSSSKREAWRVNTSTTTFLPARCWAERIPPNQINFLHAHVSNCSNSKLEAQPITTSFGSKAWFSYIWFILKKYERKSN